jgi:hypothetical protein
MGTAKGIQRRISKIRCDARQFAWFAWLLLDTTWRMYREFWQHPNYRGPKFNWLVPARIAYRQWKIY